ncbi:MAG: TolC family protein [Terracidiphilus sp.]
MQILDKREAVGQFPCALDPAPSHHLQRLKVVSKAVGSARAQYEHAIAVLIGKPPAQFSLSPSPQIQLRLPVIPVEVPSTLLERRPDVAATESRMAEANDQIGIARAAYFPSLTIGATGGFEGTTVTNWLNWPQSFLGRRTGALGNLV